MVSSRSSSGDGVDDAYVEVLDEQDDVGSGVGSPDADVAELAGYAQGDGAGLVDAVVPDPVVGAAGFELDLGGLGSLGRVGNHGAGADQDPVDRGLDNSMSWR